MGEVMDRKQLIEDAANAIGNTWAGGAHPNRTMEELNRARAEVAFAVFEGAGSFLPVASDVQETVHTDDEQAEWASEVWQSIADAIGNLGYYLNSEEETQSWVERYLLHRTVQGERLCLAEHPITGRRCSEPVSPGHGHVCDLPPAQGEPSDAQILRDEIAYRIRTAVTYGMGSRKAGRTPEQRADWIDCEVAYALGAIGAKRAALRAAAETGGER